MCLTVKETNIVHHTFLQQSVHHFLNKPEDWRKWIDAIPNNCKSLEKMKEIQICHHHFDCDWITNQGGGKQPTQPPSIFSGIPNSCCKQSSPTPRWTKTVTVKTQSTRQKYNQNLRDKSKILKLLQTRLPRGANNTLFTKRKIIIFCWQNTWAKTLYISSISRRWNCTWKKWDWGT